MEDLMQAERIMEIERKLEALHNYVGEQVEDMQRLMWDPIPSASVVPQEKGDIDKQRFGKTHCPNCNTEAWATLPLNSEHRMTPRLHRCAACENYYFMVEAEFLDPSDEEGCNYLGLIEAMTDKTDSR